MMREVELRDAYVRQVACAMMTAARTAPKGCGVDHLELGVVTREELPALADAMRRIGERDGKGFFLRDAGNVEQSQAVVLIGCRNLTRGLNCGYCGYPTCREKSESGRPTPCAFDVTDLGIAVGSAVSVAADLRVDNRVLYSAGVAAREMGLLDGCAIIYAIPLSVAGKDIYFDRKSPSCAAR